MIEKNCVENNAQSDNRLSIDEMKQIELDMIEYLDAVCRENHLRYYLVGGSMLGAVRHQGFIPWDDDIDIGMPREDFEKLYKIVNESENIYHVSFYTNQSGYGYSFPKMYDTRTKLIDYKDGYGYEESAVFLDIFILEGLGNSIVSATIWFRFLRIFRSMVFLSRRTLRMETTAKTIVFAIPWLICKCIGTDRINRLFNMFGSQKKADNSHYVALVSGRYGKKEIFCSDVFEKIVRMKFEALDLCVPAAYDTYLRTIYGEYMKLPAEEKRVSNHMNEAWWVDGEPKHVRREKEKENSESWHM